MLVLVPGLAGLFRIKRVHEEYCEVQQLCATTQYASALQNSNALYLGIQG